eukprot:SAG31_NODE_502_length_14826_cov_5.474299_4_plen_38_part_00
MYAFAFALALLDGSGWEVAYVNEYTNLFNAHHVMGMA